MSSALSLAKTIVAFANDAGGDIYVGISNSPREMKGIPESELLKTEERVTSIIHDHCAPLIVPDFTIYAEDGLYFLRIQIHRGSDFPYHLSSKGIKTGTYIRIGSSNRLADDAIITELERRKRNISFDGEVLYEKSFQELDITAFKHQFKMLTGEMIDNNGLLKLHLIRQQRDTVYPTNALALFANSDSRRDLFPYAKIECARFKGTSTDTKIDDKTITDQIGDQAAEALKFVLRHIDQGSFIEGVFTKGRWEYPIDAVREVLRNAVVHRDYSLTGKDIKVAIYDDMVEITSPGTLPPSIDFHEMDARQSDIRNKVIAPVFKKMGIIDQWGNGLKIVSSALKEYPEIELRWSEIGLQFQIQFIKRNYQKTDFFESGFEVLVKELGESLGLSWDQDGTKTGLSEPSKTESVRIPVGVRVPVSWQMIEKILTFLETPKSILEIMNLLGWKNRTKFRKKFMTPLLEFGLLQMTLPAKPNSPAQKYYCSGKGQKFVEHLRKVALNRK